MVSKSEVANRMQGLVDSLAEDMELSQQLAQVVCGFHTQKNAEEFLKSADEVELCHLTGKTGETTMCPLGAMYILQECGVLEDAPPVFCKKDTIKKVTPDWEDDQIIVNLHEYGMVLLAWPEDNEAGVLLKVQEDIFLIAAWIKDQALWMPCFNEENRNQSILLVP